MEKILIEEHMVLYNFPSVNPERLGHNIYILKDGKRALAIDTGYQQHFQQVIDDLEAEGIVVVKVVPSDFHQEHVDGIFLLNKPKVYGNQFAKITLKTFYDQEDVKVLAPKKVLSNNAMIEFGTFKLRLTSAPGHSDCSVLIDINNKYLHLGDLYMKTDQGDEVLPHVQWSGVNDHIRSLKLILKSPCSQYLLAHGGSPLGSAAIQSGVKDRIAYLSNVRRSHNKCSVEEALVNVSSPFVFYKWRKEI